MQKGNLDSALEMHQKSMDILVQLVKEKNDPEDLRDLSLCYS